jgi:hypothetical protein
VTLNQTSRGRYTRVVTLNEVKGLSERFFTKFILSAVEGLRMIGLSGDVECTNVMRSGVGKSLFLNTKKTRDSLSITPEE